jgi:hypothetical protein
MGATRRLSERCSKGIFVWELKPIEKISNGLIEQVENTPQIA